MYFKLALRNVRKSYRDFLIYFLTLTFSVCLFYTFNSFQSQQAVMQMNEAQASIIDSLSLIMQFLSIFVATVLAFLILYANNFLIRRRKKELGIYTILGMPKRKISIILIYETFIIGLTSLISGMILGIIASQVLTAVTANLFVVPLNYTFVFSTYATILTILSFSIIFIITMIFNTYNLNRYKLIDLLNADRKNDEFKIKKLWLSIILFIISILCLGWAYYETMSKGMLAFGNLASLGAIIIAGCIGTLLFFLSLAGFLLTIFKSRKSIYYKNLNCFILRQIHTNINMNFLSMSVVCIMLLLSIGALSTGLSLNNTMNTSIKNTTPYDYSFTFSQTQYNGKSATEIKEPLSEIIKKFNIDQTYIKSQDFVTTYVSGIRLGDPVLTKYIDDPTMSVMFNQVKNNVIRTIPLSAYNAVRERQGFKPIVLKNDEIYLYSTNESAAKAIHQIMKAKPVLKLYDNQMQITNTSCAPLSLATTANIGEDTIAFIINDALIPANAQPYTSYWNVDISNRTTIKKFMNYMTEKFTIYNNQHKKDQKLNTYNTVYTKAVVYNLSKGLAVIFTYIGVYLGIVFMIASAVILALQQLSQANDNKKRYVILSKIGTEQKMMNRSILMQISIYFFMPLALAIVHSIIGIQLVNTLVTIFGKGDILVSSLFTASIIIVIYGSYFLVTYFGYKNILKS